jgi:putative membrane protein
MTDTRRRGCLGLLLTWLVAGLAVMATAWLLPGVHVDGFTSALWAAVAIGLVNALVRPVMILLTLPVTLLTLGLFLLVINGLMLELADYFIGGFQVDGLLWAMAGSVVFSAVSSVLGAVLLGDDDDDDD